MQWEPPPAGHTITLLPDLFYAAYPMSVPIAAEDMPADGLSYQMGECACTNSVILGHMLYQVIS